MKIKSRHLKCNKANREMTSHESSTTKRTLKNINNRSRRQMDRLSIVEGAESISTNISAPDRIIVVDGKEHVMPMNEPMIIRRKAA